MYTDNQRTRNDHVQVQNRLVSVCREALDYYMQLKSEQHRDAWLFVIYLILEQMELINDEQFRIIGNELRDILVDMIDANVRPEVRSMLKRFVKRLMSDKDKRTTNNDVANQQPQINNARHPQN